MTRLTVRIHHGALTYVHQDDAATLMALGDAQIVRASHVEPCGTQWTADLAPVGGPLLGPFRTRGAALAAEVEWLRTQKGL